jgi:hypothetical protein
MGKSGLKLKSGEFPHPLTAPFGSLGLLFLFLNTWLVVKSSFLDLGKKALLGQFLLKIFYGSFYLIVLYNYFHIMVSSILCCRSYFGRSRHLRHPGH